MKTLYAMLVFSSIVVAAWYALAGYMIYQIGKDMNAWHTCKIYIDRWLKWRYGFGN